METLYPPSDTTVVWWYSFNFLASLINGNPRLDGFCLLWAFNAFNFLASLINGNVLETALSL
jgi:hypothetical protein